MAIPDPQTQAPFAPDAGRAPFLTLVDALLAAPPSQPFVTMWRDEDDVESADFGRFRQLVFAQAAFLRDNGLLPGDRLVLIMDQGIPLMSTFVAAFYLGAVPAILAYPNLKVDPAKYRFGLAGVTANLNARLAVLDQNFPDELLGHVALGGGATLVRALNSPPPVSDPPPPAARPDSLAFIQHSAGTTGLQKGVALSHQAVISHLRRLAPALRLSPSDRIYSWLPLYHDMGLIACFMLPLFFHLELVMQSPNDWVMQPASMLELISTRRCSLAWVPNFALQFLARRVRLEDRAFDLSSLRALINCSEPVRASSIDEFFAAYRSCSLAPTAVQSCYAMAETVFAVSQSDLDRPPARSWISSDLIRREHRAVPVQPTDPSAVCFTSSGRPIPGVQVRIDAPDVPGAIGEILIHAESMFSGYFNRPDLTERALQDGWYRSGDLGFQLDGELYVTGRKKDMIIVAGENIYPQDVEEIVSAHPSVHDGRVVAFGRLDPDVGTEEIVVVAEVNSEDQLAGALRIELELRNAIMGQLSIAARRIFLKPPKWVVKSTAGKPARSSTRDKLLDEHPELRPPSGPRNLS